MTTHQSYLTTREMECALLTAEHHRLRALNADLLAALSNMTERAAFYMCAAGIDPDTVSDYATARAAIAKAKEQGS